MRQSTSNGAYEVRVSDVVWTGHSHGFSARSLILHFKGLEPGAFEIKCFEPRLVKSLGSYFAAWRLFCSGTELDTVILSLEISTVQVLPECGKAFAACLPTS